jgi:soluble lytic murein transglycosylase-like protein
MWWLSLFLLQDASSQAERIRVAMEPSLEKQRAAVRLQAKSAGARMAPWTAPEAPEVSRAEFDCPPMPQLELGRMIDDVARENRIDPALIREAVRQESGFHACAVSPKGAEGMMQLMPATQARFHVRDPFDPKESSVSIAKGPFRTSRKQRST